MKKNMEKHIKELRDRGFIIVNLSNVTNTTTKITFRCSKCGEEFVRTIKSAKITNPYCTKCCYRVSAEKLSKTKTPKEKWVKFFEGKNFKDYFFKEGKCYIKCRRCGAIVQKIYSDMTKQKHFDLCGKCSRVEHIINIDSIFVLNTKLENMGIKTRCTSDIKHFGNKDRVEFTCECGNKFIRKPNTVLSGLYLCSDCTKQHSYNEILISKILKNHNLDFYSEYIFENCKNIRPLPFDFYLKDLNVCIEYDGIQHYEEVDFFECNLKERQRVDKIKNDYCLENKIYLIRIKYTNNNYEQELMNIINNITQGNLEPSILEIN